MYNNKILGLSVNTRVLATYISQFSFLDAFMFGFWTAREQGCPGFHFLHKVNKW